MKIWVYTHCKNERVIMPYFLRHYATMADKIIVIDDKSTDGTPEIVQGCINAGMPVELRKWPGKEGLDDKEFLDVIYSIYPEAAGQAEWILWVDTDELVYDPNIQIHLQELAANNVIRPSGWSMFSHQLPTTGGQIYEEIKNGIPGDGVYDKPVIFRPETKIRWNLGRHDFRSIEGIREARAPYIKLLHYRWLGLEYSKDRNTKNYVSLSPRARASRWGFTVFPDWHGDHSHEWVEKVLAEGKPQPVI